MHDVVRMCVCVCAPLQGVNSRLAVRDLPASVRSRIMLELCASTIRNVPLFHDVDQHTMRSIVTALVVEVVPPVPH